MMGLLIDSLKPRMRWLIASAFVLTLTCVRAEIRTWTSDSGSTVDAQFLSLTIRNEVVLEQEGGKQIKVPLTELSSNDAVYVELQHPPDISIEFGDSSKIDTLDNSDRFQDNPTVIEETVSFNVRIKQLNTKDYPYPLTVEYYAIGYQYLDHDKYILLDKGKEEFVLSYDNKRAVRFETETMNFPLEFTLIGNHYGFKYSNYLVLVFDQRGELIAHEESRKRMFTYRERLRELPRGAFFDDTCIRRHASGPKRYY